MKNAKLFLILIDGPIGSGKSTTAKLLHKKLKRTALISLDKIKFFLSDYRPVDEDLSLAHDIGKAMTKEYLKHGISVIVEKAFTKKEFVEDFLKGAKLSKISSFVYQIEAPIEVAFERVAKRAITVDIFGQPHTKPSKRKIQKNFKHYYASKYEKAKVFDSGVLTPQKIVKEIMKDIISS